MEKYFCPKCGGEAHPEEMLVGRTTHANEDDEFETFLICSECGHEENVS